MKNIALLVGIAALLVACARQDDDMGGTETTQTETERSAATNNIGTPTTPSPTTTPPPGQGQPAIGGDQDQRISMAVKNAIAAEPGRPNAQQIQVNVRNGVVTLQGTVQSMEEKQEIEKQAKAVAGVTRVDNQLQVSGQGGTTPQGESGGQQQNQQQPPQQR